MIRIFILSMVLFILFGCNSESLNTDSDSLLEGTRITTSPKTFNEASTKRGESYSAPFHITDVKRSEDILKIYVSHTYACVSGYEIIWNGAIMESFPYQTRMFVRFVAQCKDEPTIQIMVEEVLEVDLAEMIVDRHVLKNIIVHVSNASSIQEVNSDEPVSNN